jgi:DNA-binding protein H-NS
MATRGKEVNIATLQAMSVNELWSLHEELHSVLYRKLSEKKASLDRQLQLLTPGAGAREQTRRPYPAVFPKYQNPEQPSETWAGRGRQPRWLSSQLQFGKQLEDFRIPLR